MTLDIIEIVQKPNGKFTLVILESDEDGAIRRSPGVNTYETREEAEEAKGYWLQWFGE